MKLIISKFTDTSLELNLIASMFGKKEDKITVCLPQ